MHILELYGFIVLLLNGLTGVLFYGYIVLLLYYFYYPQYRNTAIPQYRNTAFIMTLK